MEQADRVKQEYLPLGESQRVCPGVIAESRSHRGSAAGSGDDDARYAEGKEAASDAQTMERKGEKVRSGVEEARLENESMAELRYQVGRKGSGRVSRPDRGKGKFC